MKCISLFSILLICAISVFSQATEGTVNFKKNKEAAAVIELPYSSAVVNASLSEYLSKKGRSKETDARGFTTFRNTQQVQGDSINADLYFKVDGKDKQSSIVSLLVTQDVSKSTATNTVSNMTMDQAKAYLDELVPIIESYNLELLINQQNEAIIKAESKFKSIRDDVSDLDKKKLSIEKDIEEKKKILQRQEEETILQKQKLAELVQQRKN
jgi:hypothetical protein